MSRTVTVEVTAEDIAKGRPNRCGECPVALALRRATGQKLYVNDQGEWHDDENGGEYSENFVVSTSLDTREHGAPSLPEDAQAFVRRIDAGLPVEPFTFTVELPS